MSNLTYPRDVWTATNPTGGSSSWISADIDGTNDLDSISCASSVQCVAVDDAGNILSSTNPNGGSSAWAAANLSATAFEAVSCPSTSLCVAVSDGGNVYTASNPTGGASAWSGATIDAHSLFSVGCGSPTFCVAVDNNGQALVSFNPTGGASAWSASSVDGTNSIYSIDCNGFLCVAGDGNGNAFKGVISGISQAITFTSTAPSSATVNTSYFVTATGGASGNPVTFSVDGASGQGVCTVSGSRVNFLNGGTCVIDANQAGTVNYAAAPQVQQSVFVLTPRPSSRRPSR